MKAFRGKSKVFEAIADKEIQDREEEQLELLAREVDEIKRLLVEIKEKQTSTRGLVDTFRSADYDLEAVYERARQWRHARDDWSREYTPTPPPMQNSNIHPSEKSFLEELEEAGDTMDPLEEVEEDEVEAVEAATADCEDEAKEEESKEEGSKDDNANEENEGNAADTTGDNAD